jgi:hypothetical protein
MAKAKKRTGTKGTAQARLDTCRGCGEKIDLNNSDWVVLYDAQTEERNLVHYATADGWPCADRLGEINK